MNDSFPPKRVEKIKNIDGRRYIPEKKCWVIPFKHDIIKEFYRLFRGEEIKLNQFMSSFLNKKYKVIF